MPDYSQVLPNKTEILVFFTKAPEGTKNGDTGGFPTQV
jgi:hypothetical protein